MSERVVRARLEDLIQATGEDYASLSRRLGRNPAYIQQFIKRGVPRRLAEEDRRILARHFKVSEAFLGGLAAEPPPAAAPAAGDLGLIPYLVQPEVPPGEALALSAEMARQLAPDPGQLAAAYIMGDAMAPTLVHGDRILIDRGARLPLRDGLYALDPGSGPLVRRVLLDAASGAPIASADNPLYGAAAGPVELEKVVGRVVWVGRVLR